MPCLATSKTRPPKRRKTVDIGFVCLAVLLLGITPIGQGATVYKWVDEDGNISYHDKPPPTDKGQVEEKIINPNKNVMQPFVAPKSTAKSPAGQTAGSNASSTGGTTNKGRSRTTKDAAIAEGRTASDVNTNPLAPTSTPSESPVPAVTAPPALTTPPPPSAPPPPAPATP